MTDENPHLAALDAHRRALDAERRSQIEANQAHERAEHERIAEAEASAIKRREDFRLAAEAAVQRITEAGISPSVDTPPPPPRRRLFQRQPIPTPHVDPLPYWVLATRERYVVTGTYLFRGERHDKGHYVTEECRLYVSGDLANWPFANVSDFLLLVSQFIFHRRTLKR